MIAVIIGYVRFDMYIGCVLHTCNALRIANTRPRSHVESDDVVFESDMLQYTSVQHIILAFATR